MLNFILLQFQFIFLCSEPFFVCIIDVLNSRIEDELKEIDSGKRISKNDIGITVVFLIIEIFIFGLEVYFY